ncbi:MAG: exodeoxyribonuclease VII large subunit, partial [Candidatus Puniceispirillaceae bacterium]
RQLAEAKAGLSELSLRLTKSMALDLERRQQATDNVGRLLDANSFKRVLDRGFALVTDLHGVPVKRSAEAPLHAHTLIRFADGQRHAQLDPQDKTPQDAAVKPRKKPKSASPPDQKQDDLF